MKRLRAKKGFTLVELIVVIALIAILLAIVIPLFTNTSAYKNDAVDKAHAFYSNVQEAVTDEKVNETAFPAVGKMIVWAEVRGANTQENDNRSTAAVDVYVGSVDDDTSVKKVFTTDEGGVVETSDKYKIWAEFGSTVSKLLSTTDVSGNFYAVVDTKYRVESAFFVRSPSATYDKIKGNKYSSDRRVKYNDGSSEQEVYIGAYPSEYWNNVPEDYTFFGYRAPTP